MDAAVVGLIVFACTFAGALFGMWLRTALPAHHLDSESKDTVRIGVGLIATMTALVLGLVTSSAKSSFDAGGHCREAECHRDPRHRSLTRSLRARDRRDSRGPAERGRRSNRHDLAAGFIQACRSGPDPRRNDVPDRANCGRNPGSEATGRFPASVQARALDLAEALLQARWIVFEGTGRKSLCRSLRSSCSGSRSHSRVSACSPRAMPPSSPCSSFVQFPLVAPCFSYWRWMGRSTA